jgi:hypothetical protein
VGSRPRSGRVLALPQAEGPPSAQQRRPLIRLTAWRKHRSFAGGFPNAPIAPFGALQDRRFERAVSATKRSLAEGVDCTTTDCSGRKLRTRNASVAERVSTTSHQKTASVQSDDGAGISPRVATTAQSQVVGDSRGLPLSAKAKRRSTIAIPRDHVRAVPLPNDLEADSAGTSRVDDRSPQRRKRTIMTRYVFGDELKPSERWKRRLLAMR